MRLHAKIIVLLIALFAVYGVIDYTVQQRVILPSFEALETDLARTDMERVSHALDRELSQLLVFCADWGNWFDTYQYIQNHNSSFIEENMTQATIEAADLNIVAFLNNDSQFIWTVGYDPKDFSSTQFAMLQQKALPPDSAFRQIIAAGKQARGIVNTEHGPALIAIAPILDGAGKGPHRGAVLLGRILTHDGIAKLAEQAQVNLQMITPALGFGAIRIAQSEQTNEVYRDIADMTGRPAFTFKVDVPRSITERGRSAIHYALGSLLIAGAIVLWVLLWSLRRMILRPVTRMTRHAVNIGESDDLTQRLNVHRSDELGVLAREFDRMLERFADARRHLVDKSFEAGLAEMASGVLHNVGNALTPIAVRTADMQSTLTAIPASDLQVVLSELANGASDAARRVDLQEFLRLACEEMLNATSRMSADVQSVADGVQAIQAMLNDRVHFSRTGPVIELVRIEDVVRDALRLVPPQRLEAVEVTIDDSVPALGTVRLARVTMQQVFQNLIVNACEAMPQGVRGQIKVSARVTGPEGDRQLNVAFADNGAGIAPEHLSTIFNKGFSTKPLTNNSGLGLHWSANVVNALGGKIHAESPGRGGGAVFHVVLPLHKAASDPGAIAA
jgi:two-component system, NtrC family, sensor kinase